jgi:hypothetical protein
MKLSLIHTLGKLRKISFEIRGLAYLIRLKKKDEVTTEDLEVFYYGIGSLLDQLGKNISRVTRQVEEEISPHSRKNKDKL